MRENEYTADKSDIPYIADRSSSIQKNTSTDQLQVLFAIAVLGWFVSTYNNLVQSIFVDSNLGIVFSALAIVSLVFIVTKMAQSTLQPGWKLPVVGDLGKALRLIYSILTLLTILTVVLLFLIELISLVLPPTEYLIYILQIMVVVISILGVIFNLRSSLGSPDPSIQLSYKINEKEEMVTMSVALSKVPESYLGTDKLGIQIITPEEIETETTSSIEVIPDEEANEKVSTALFNFEMNIEDINREIGREDLVTIIANVGDWTDRVSIPSPNSLREQ